MDLLFPNGFKYPPDFHIPTPTGTELFRIGPVGYTNAHLTMALVIVLLGSIAILTTRDLRERPGGLQNLVELAVQGLADFVESIGGKKALRYLPLFGTLFLFIVTANWLSVVPFIGQIEFLHSPTADYHTNFAMAVLAFVAYQTEGFRHLKLSYVKRWFNFSGFKDGPFIGVIFVLVGFIELFSEIFRMLTLTLRLWGNVFGGEIMLVVMSGLLFLPGLALPFVGLEVFIGLVQGLVFALLVLMYFILAIESHDEEHEEGSASDTDRVPSPEMHPRPVAAH
ncbi:MAG: ATP synthase F0 subunit A [Chloroflexi bacterium 13_1_40CM_4_68_4]|nr:MAG: ATP synthase F0 subunit A [Chloroflexi bacterium 13_1_40CM_4_68_4]